MQHLRQVLERWAVIWETPEQRFVRGHSLATIGVWSGRIVARGRQQSLTLRHPVAQLVGPVKDCASLSGRAANHANSGRVPHRSAQFAIGHSEHRVDRNGFAE
jgi:hypothetical protein